MATNHASPQDPLEGDIWDVIHDCKLLFSLLKVNNACYDCFQSVYFTRRLTAGSFVSAVMIACCLPLSKGYVGFETSVGLFRGSFLLICRRVG